MGQIKPEFTFIDLFAGIGGFHTAMHSVGGKCVFASEWDKNARITYEENYKAIEPGLFEKDEDGKYKYFNADINDVELEKVPDFDVLCGGFPCQAFSIAGKRKGFEDTRGTLFFNIAAIVNHKIKIGKKPKVLFLENVKGLKNHDQGKTLETLLRVLREDLEYEVRTMVLNAKYFGVPQNRERLFFVCWDKKQCPSKDFKFPLGLDKNLKSIFEKDQLQNVISTKVSDILEPDSSIPEKMTISDKMWIGHQLRKARNRANGKGFGYCSFTPDSAYTSTISRRYYKDGSEILIEQPNRNPRKLTPREATNLQGYPHNFKIHHSNIEAYKQAGNSVAVPVVEHIANEIINQFFGG